MMKYEMKKQEPNCVCLVLFVLLLLLDVFCGHCVFEKKKKKQLKDKQWQLIIIFFFQVAG